MRKNDYNESKFYFFNNVNKEWNDSKFYFATIIIILTTIRFVLYVGAC